MSPEPSPDTVSVVVVSHDYGRFLDEAMTSVMDQSRRPDEVVIVDDASRDATPTVAERWVRCHPAIRCVRSEISLGPARAFNTGLHRASGALLVKLDADDSLSDRYVERHVQVLTETGADIAYAGVEHFGAECRWIPAVPFDPTELGRENFINGSAMMRRRVFDATGGYRVELDGLGLEDWEFFVHAVALGMRAVPVDGCRLRYRRHASGSRNSLTRLDALRTHLLVRRLHPETVSRRQVATWMGRSVSRNIAGAVGLR